MPLLESIIGFVTPHICLNCAAEGSLLCQTCQIKSCPPMPPTCFRCREEATPNNALCASCQIESPLDTVYVGTAYNHHAQKLVHELKFNRARNGSAPIANVVAARTPSFAPNTLVVPVPTATSRVRQRGYDQAVLIARRLAQHKRLAKRNIVRRLGQGRQVGANRQQRLDAKDRAFYIRTRKLPHHVLLVDDILTTGATLEVVAQVLRQAGVQRIDAAVFAQRV